MTALGAAAEVTSTGAVVKVTIAGAAAKVAGNGAAIQSLQTRIHGQQALFVRVLSLTFAHNVTAHVTRDERTRNR